MLRVGLQGESAGASQVRQRGSREGKRRAATEANAAENRMSDQTSTTPNTPPDDQRQAPQSGAAGGAPEHQSQDQQFQDKVHGEGNYQASRDFQRDAKNFAESGKVEQAARDARPESDQQAEDLEKAEQAGRERAKK
jgi:hypothetical protein